MIEPGRHYGEPSKLLRETSPWCEQCQEHITVTCVLGNPTTAESVEAVKAILLAAHIRIAHGHPGEHDGCNYLAVVIGEMWFCNKCGHGWAVNPPVEARNS
jgi:hypothetical protein